MKDVTLITTKKIRYRHLFRLPYAWYRHILPLFTNIRKNIKKKNPEGKFLLAYAVFLSVCFCDRKFIDIALNNIGQEKFPVNIELQNLLYIGSALYDLGYRDEGIMYFERCLDLSLNQSHSTTDMFACLACCRMNNKTHWKRRLDYAIALTKQDPDESIVHGLLCRAYIDLKNFDKAEDLLKKLIEHSYEYAVLYTDLSFSKGDYKAAADAFDKYQLHDYFHYWRMQYDYKKALAYNYSDQPEKMRKQALKIKRRLKWDRFYRTDSLEEEGIKREEAIDSIINSDELDKILIDPEKIRHYVKALGWILYYWFISYWYAIPIVLALGLILL